MAAGGVAVQVLDLGLPDMDGLDVLRALRERGDDVPVIIVTARNDVRDRETAMRLGIVAYLRKPFALRELLDAVRASAGRGRGHAGRVSRTASAGVGVWSTGTTISTRAPGSAVDATCA